jgi:glycerophosphoryl diester phosphodiesterase
MLSVNLILNLKGKGTANKVHQIISYYIKDKGWSKEDFIISSFYWDELSDFRALDKEIAIAVLTEENPLKAIPTAERLEAVAINPYYKTLEPETVKQIQQKGFKVYTLYRK